MAAVPTAEVVVLLVAAMGAAALEVMVVAVKARFQSEAKTFNKRMLSDWFSAAPQTSRKCGR
ncbi:hypothetical protein [Marinimicrobium sp. ABcell2]|uniref:hypothetical protein n=1 Tax=Marinimicrobium sp. ABcell2 TaxID=3069751 RepID=UPI0027B3E624|nr:hypothetical protein [Marinimicrobium sp. ABcell2]MDQ2078529.1 hypothetical protein [Marinimicrobium sp. ABcell2]